MNRCISSALVMSLLLAGAARGADWIDHPNMWGVQGGIKFGIWPASVEEDPADQGGPQGLIRIGFPTAPGGGYELINFVAIEPLVNGQLSQSEMQGVVLTADNPVHVTVDGGVDQMDVTVHAAPFANGAHVSVTCSVREDHPNELRFRIHKEGDSADMSMCNLTATMGNKCRVREAHLKGQTLSSLAMYGGLSGDAFGEDHEYGMDQMETLPNGDWIVRFNSDEANPGDTVPPLDAWYYRGPKITQYWIKPQTSPHNNLRFRVNARATYFGTNGTAVIPNGVAFENLDMRDNFADGEDFVYGIQMP